MNSAPTQPILPADAWRHCLTYSTPLELLRANVLSKELFNLSNNSQVRQWREFVDHSDRLRKNIFRAERRQSTKPIDRAGAIAILL